MSNSGPLPHHRNRHRHDLGAHSRHRHPQYGQHRYLLHELTPATHDHFPGAAVHAWYSWTGWLPAPLKIVSFVVVAWFAGRAALRYLVPLLARIGAHLVNGVLRAAAWLIVAPEYAVTSALIRGGNLNLHGPFYYGETVAGLLEAGEGGVRQVSGMLERTRRVPGKLAFCSVIATLLLVNVAAYRVHGVWPLTKWWHSMANWIHTLDRRRSP
jgi:hypothetical protein